MHSHSARVVAYNLLRWCSLACACAHAWRTPQYYHPCRPAPVGDGWGSQSEKAEHEHCSVWEESGYAVARRSAASYRDGGTLHCCPAPLSYGTAIAHSAWRQCWKNGQRDRVWLPLARRGGRQPLRLGPPRSCRQTSAPLSQSLLARAFLQGSRCDEECRPRGRRMRHAPPRIPPRCTRTARSHAAREGTHHDHSTTRP